MGDFVTFLSLGVIVLLGFVIGVKMSGNFKGKR